MIFRLTAALLIMVSCSPTGGAEEVADETIDEIAEDVSEGEATPIVIAQCDAEDYRPLIGTSLDAATLPEGQFFRAYGENDIITQEYLPRRTNVVYDARKVVRDVYCG